MESITNLLEREFHTPLKVPFEDYHSAIKEIYSLRNQNKNVTLDINEGDSSKFLQYRVINLEKNLSLERKKNSELQIELQKIKKDRDFYKTQYEKENKQYTEVSQK
jgi:hypothetical protein